MDNRGFPTAGGEGKGGFPYQAMNGGYPAMCYPGQEMMLPYGQYGAGPEAQFNEQCAAPQQVPQGAASYGFGAQAHQYMQHYRQQAHIMQAAYSTAQHQNRVSNPQQIADSIYMAAHAYSYQQQNPSLPQAPNSYSPGGGGGRTALNVRTGPSPANSLHSPAGSTQSLGERPMLSPRAQSNAQMYNNYHHTNNQPPNNRTVAAQQQQQVHVQPMNYYTNGSSHPTHPNGCMNAELDHRRSIERLAAISHPSEQFSHVQKVNSPSHVTGAVPKSQYYQPPVTASVSMAAAPVSACQHRTDLPKARRQHPPTNRKQPVTAVSSPNLTNQSSFQSKPTVSSPGEPKNPASCVRVIAPTQPVISNVPVVSNAVTKGTELVEDDRPKEAAVDSGIDSEQVDKDNDEEHDTSTTSNKSENSPHPPKMSDANSELDMLVTPCADEPYGGTTPQRQGDGDSRGVTDPSSKLKTAGNSSTTPTLTDKVAAPMTVATSTVSEQLQTSTAPNTLIMTVTGAEGDSHAANDDDSKDGSSFGDHRSVECDQLNSSLQQSDLSDSFGSQFSSSLSSSSASKKSMGDESRLPPRKRKQQLSEHTQSFKTAMPIKKRGRPSKEALRLREAAKLAELTDPMAREENSSHKERKFSFSSNKGKDVKLKSPVHNGSLLQSPKLNLGAKEEKSNNQPSLDGASNKIETDKVSFTTLQDNNEDALALKSNAVLISPPRKPKARVSAMQKALQLVSNDPTGEVFLPGRKKRGRPLGSKNRRTKGDMRARSNSVGSAGKGQRVINFAGEEGKEEAGNNPSEAGGSNGNSSTSSNVTSQSQRLSLSVQNRTKSLHYRKNKSLSPKSSTNATEPVLPTSTDSWVCVFCQHVSNFRDLGDLFGGYNIQPRTPVAAKVVPHRKASDLRFQQLLDKKCRPNEIWFHERCIIWSPGVYMLGGNLYGVYEAIVAAFQTTCSSCEKKGAILGCFYKGCTQRYHLHCAEIAECSLNEENFSMLCTKHKDKKIVLM